MSGTVRAHGHEQPQLPGDDLGDETDRLEAVDHAVGEAGQFDAQALMTAGAAQLQPAVEFEDGAAVLQGGPGIGGAERGRVACDRLGDPGRRHEASDHALAVIGLEAVDAASLAGQPLPDRQQQAGHDMHAAFGEFWNVREFGIPGGRESRRDRLPAIGSRPAPRAAMAGRSIGRSRRTRRSTEPSSSIRLGAGTCTAARPDCALIEQLAAGFRRAVERLVKRERPVAVLARRS